MSSEIVSSLAGVFGTILGVLVGYKLSKKAARDLMTQQEKAQFLSSLIPTLKKLHAKREDVGVGEASEIMQHDYPAHLSAYLKLRAVVPRKEREAIERAWRDYTKDDQYELKEEQGFYRFSHIFSGETDEHQTALAIENINRLINAINT